MGGLGREKGFSLIELLVVIAIIGILASVVMDRQTVARAKTSNIAIKANLENLRTQASLVFASTSSYNNICADPIFVQGLTQAGTLGGAPANCFSAENAWVVTATMQEQAGEFSNWCVDSTGKSKGITAMQYGAITSSATLCP